MRIVSTLALALIACAACSPTGAGNGSNAAWAPRGQGREPAATVTVAPGRGTDCAARGTARR
jgi:hypothetical protein